jgi:hypothetical protein
MPHSTAGGIDGFNNAIIEEFRANGGRVSALTHPSGCHNLKASPRIEVEVGAEAIKAGRQIPLFVLAPHHRL